MASTTLQETLSPVLRLISNLMSLSGASKLKIPFVDIGENPGKPEKLIPRTGIVRFGVI